MVSYPHKPKSGHFTCYLNRIYHVLTTTSATMLASVAVFLYNLAAAFEGCLPNSSGTATTQGTLRFLRIVHGILLFSMVLYPTLVDSIVPLGQKAPSRMLPVALGSISAAIIGYAVWFQITRVRPALEALQLKPDDATSLQRWRSGSILSFVLFESVVLYGFALRFMGGTLQESVPFYGAGIALMLIYWPKQP